MNTRSARKLEFIRVDTYHALAIAALERGDRKEYERLSTIVDDLDEKRKKQYSARLRNPPKGGLLV